MVNLLMKFYEISSGDIVIDGTSIKDLSRENIHSLFTMVLQDTWLFEGTIKENIVYNRENVSDEQVKEFFNHNLIQMNCELSDLIHEQNKILRSDIGRIIQSGILDRYSAKYFKEKAESIKDTKNIPLEINNNKIVIPVKKSDRNEVLKFLKNTIVQSVLDGELYRTNSKRLLVSG